MNLLSLFSLSIFAISTGSMAPALNIGDLIVVIPQKTYKVGQIVTFSTGNGFKTHRITKTKSNTIITKGDANAFEDTEAITQKQVIGTVIAKIPIVGYIPIKMKKVASSCEILLNRLLSQRYG